MKTFVAARRLDSLRQRLGEKHLVTALLLLALLLRLAAVAQYKGLQPIRDENQMVAASIARGQGYANAFRPDSGPTAHTGPLAPLPMAGIYRMFGIETPVAEAVLNLCGILSVLLAFFLAYRCFAILSASRRSRLLGLGFLCLAPMQLSLESREAAIWDFGYVACMMFGYLFLVLRIDRAERVNIATLVMLAFAAALIEMAGPAAGLACAAAFGLLLVRRMRWPYWILMSGLTLVFYLALTTPWAMRNERMLGAPIRSRSSFGLSFAIGYYQGQVDGSDRRHANVSRLADIHPHRLGGPGYARMISAGGEVPYNRKLIAETRAWISSHRSDAAGIALRNFASFYLPPTWLWARMDSGPIPTRTIVRSAVALLVGLSGFLTLGWLLATRRWAYLYIAAVLLLLSVPYIASFALLRYRFPAGIILTFLAFLGAEALLTRTPSRRSGPEPG